MHGHIPFGTVNAREIERNKATCPERIFRPLFGPVAKVIWPHKTAAQLASIAGSSERAAAHWLSGEIEPPGVVLAAVLNEITKRQ